jgi:phage baseplate assembly protein W
MNPDFPFHFDTYGHTAATNRDEHIHDMIELLLFTDPGERVFAPNSPELAAALQFAVQAALQRWLGDIIELEELAVESYDAELRVRLHYRVRYEETSTVLELTRAV